MRTGESSSYNQEGTINFLLYGLATEENQTAYIDW
jgi:hypothetical protein